MGQAGSRRQKLRSLLARPGILVVPGAVDAITARVIEEVGFEAVYATGAGYSNAAFGLPDLGLVTLTEMVAQVERMVESVDIPLIADADTGYGGVLNVRRTVQLLERAGAAAIQIEDQSIPKRCGHFDGNSVVPEREMVQKLRAAIDARSDPNLLIVARTDAQQTEGFDSAVARARAYAKAGADLIFVEAPRTLQELELLPKLIDAPLIANMVEGGKTPLVSASDLGAMGYRVALFANTALRVSVKATRSAMHLLHSTGDASTLLDQMLTWSERQELIGLPRLQEIENRLLSDGIN